MEAAQELAELALPLGMYPADGPTPEFIPRDLLDRIRAGMALGDFKQARIDKEADWFAKHPEYIERIFTRAAPYLHYIVGEVEARGLPMELALLPVIESAFQPYAYSRARATGLWQFMPATGGRFGLKQDWWYDGRRDVVAATQAALDYLQYLHGMFDGDWLLAVAAYNCGEGNVSRAIRNAKAARKKTDFWNLQLPAETRAYVPRLLAMSRHRRRPRALWPRRSKGMPDEPYFMRVETGGQINIEVAAELAGITTRRNVRPEPGVPSLGHRSHRPALPAGAGRIGRRVPAEPAAADARPAPARRALHRAQGRHGQRRCARASAPRPNTCAK